jgi:hypothetical protein
MGWFLLSANLEIAKTLAIELKGLIPVTVYLGLGAGFLLLGFAISEAEEDWKTYWREHNWKGLKQVSLYYALNLILAALPIFIISHSYELIQQLGLFPFLVSVTLLLAVLTFYRFEGLSRLGVSTCAR